jgi:hypothetical protein
MGNTYTRQSTNEIATGLVINAADLNAEFNALLDAFSSSDGHTHDGTANEGGRIEVFGQAGELRGTNANVIQPFQDDTVDLGTTSAKFKDFYLDGIAYLDTINLDGTAITSTGTELNIVDGSTSATSTTLANADRLIVNDNGTMVQVALTDFETYFESELDTLSNVTTVGALSSGSIASGFGAITTTNTITFGTLSDGTISIAGFKDEDDMSSNSNTHLPTQQSVKAYVDSQVTAQDLDFQADSGGALSIDLDSETLTFTGGTGIDTSGSGNTVTFSIDSTVATLAGAETLTNKTLTTPIIEEIDSSSTITLDAGTNIILNADGGNISLQDANATYGSLTNTSGNLIIKSGTTTALTFAGANATFAGTVAVGQLTLNGNSLLSSGAINLTPTGSNAVVIDGLSFPVADGNANEILKTDGNGVLSFSTVANLFTEQNDLSTNVTWANVPDANITQSSVTQHEAALSVTESQITDLQSYLTSVSVNDISDTTITSVADNELLAYDSSSSKWINQTPTEAGFATVATSGAYSDLSGTPTIPSGGAGGVNTTGFSQVGSSTSTTTYGSHVTRATVTITPSTTSAKILLLTSMEISHVTPSASGSIPDEQERTNRGQIALKRNGTELSGSLRELRSGGFVNSGSTDPWYYHLSTQYVDQPNTTSSVTYTVTSNDLDVSPIVFDIRNCSLIAVEISA